MAKKPQKQNLDFTNVKEGSQFNKRHLPEGDYRARVNAVDEAEAKSGNKMWVFTIEIKTKAGKSTYPYYCPLVDNQLWKLRSLWAAAGVAIPRKRVALDPNTMVGKLIGVTLQDSEYKDKINSEISFMIPLSDLPADNSADEGEDEEEEEEEEEEEDDTEEEDEPPTPPKKVVKKAAAKSAKKAPEPEPEEEEEEEEDEEEELPPLPPKKRGRPKGSKNKKAPEPEEDDDLDLDI